MSDSRLGKSRRNIAAGLMQYALNLLLVWIGRIIFVRVLSQEYLGINGLFTNIISVLSIADLGIPTAMTYSLYKPLAEKDSVKIAAMVSFFRKVYLVIAGAVLITGLCLIPVLPYVVKLDSPVPNLEVYYVLILANTVITYLFIYRTTLFTADQKNYILQRYTMIFRVVAFAVQTILLFMFRNYIVYLIGGTVTGIVSNIVQNIAAGKHYPYLKDPAEKLSDSDKKEIRKNVFDLFLYRLCGTIQNNTDSILISLFAGTILVGHYSNYQMMIVAITSILTIVFTSIKASLGNMIASKDTTDEKKIEVYWTMEKANFWLTAFCSVSFMCLFQDFVELSFGPEYVISLVTVGAIVLNFYTSNIRQPVWAFRETVGMFRETRHISAVTAVVNLVLSILLGYFWGMTGVLVATVISRMVYAWWKEPLILFRKYFKCSPRKYFTNYILNALIFAVLCAACYFICGAVRLPNIYVGFGLKVLICAVFPNLVFFLFYWRDPAMRDLIKRILSR